MERHPRCRVGLLSDLANNLSLSALREGSECKQEPDSVRGEKEPSVRDGELQRWECGHGAPRVGDVR